MDGSVLIATSTPPFGMLIQQTLEDSGRYAVVLVESGRQALEQAEKRRFSLCILDYDLEDMQQGALFEALRETNLGMRMMVVPPQNDQNSPLLAGLPVDAFLTKPFYLPDLMDLIDRVIQKDQPAGTAEVASDGLLSGASLPGKSAPSQDDLEVPSWLQDVTRAAQYLTRLTLESAAEAALIVHHDKMLAYAGELPQPAGEELASVVAQYWGRDGGSDLARFVRLKSVGGEFMLYATRLVGGMVLALVFNVETPFSKIRSQAGRLARALASPPASENETQPKPSGFKNNGWEQEIDSKQGLSAGGWDSSFDELPALPPLFDDVPPPSPNGFTRKSLASIPSWSEKFQRVEPYGPVYPDRVKTAGVQRPVEKEILPIPEQSNTTQLEDAAGQVESGDSKGETGWIQEWVQEKGSSPEDGLGETRPTQAKPSPAVAEISPLQIDLPEAVSPDMQFASPEVCSLHFACLLIPRLPQHHLTGELAIHLSEWMSQLSLAFGWRLEHLAIRPEYLQWIFSVPPSTSPSHLMGVIRHHTSLRIFTQEPVMAQENPSGDFWAPGYLIMTSSQPVPPQVVLDFISQTRQRQGAARPIPRQH